MSPEAGEHLMLWSVRTSVVCYVVALWRWVCVPVSPDRTYSRFWLAAWLLCVLHVFCAFHFRHHWNHAAAIEHTAQMTERVVGLYWGGGLYINYIFLILWGISAVFTSGFGVILPTGIDRSLHAFTAFMMFNATAVFGPVWWWIPAFLAVTTVVYGIMKTRRSGSQN